MFKRAFLSIAVVTSILTLILSTLSLKPDYTNIIAYVTNKSQTGGGTGFHVKAPSGQKYLITNDHVCRGAVKDGVVYVRLKDTDRPIPRRVIELSGKTDLCIVEGMPQADVLRLSSNDPEPGQELTVVGHPMLLPLTSTYGEAIANMMVKLLVDIDPSPGECNEPKNSIEMVKIFVFSMPACMVNIKAVITTVQVKPGNSGSPVLDSSYRVRGIVFAGDNTLGWAAIVPVSELHDFLSVY